ncbi:phage terminase large subunit family protein [Massilia sp. TS11]|uniref:phage terminase large subunit family protein n=1 Tax=Massilia sp. TS11 TaxID=2908003 RepID=UPI001EDB15DC|nr:phage terminase large subunit family protein [Massilia sp. TS11]MCG2585731.1 phage terminase large subunit family protein [Massilia sp. TS11]
MSQPTSNLRPRRPAPPLILHELAPASVIDLPDSELVCHLTTFGSSRETCPHCSGRHLQLVLRQENVRQAHLLCPGCGRCFDASYPDGQPALCL